MQVVYQTHSLRPSVWGLDLLWFHKNMPTGRAYIFNYRGLLLFMLSLSLGHPHGTCFRTCSAGLTPLVPSYRVMFPLWHWHDCLFLSDYMSRGQVEGWGKGQCEVSEAERAAADPHNDSLCPHVGVHLPSPLTAPSYL